MNALYALIRRAPFTSSVIGIHMALNLAAAFFFILFLLLVLAFHHNGIWMLSTYVTGGLLFLSIFILLVFGLFALIIDLVRFLRGKNLEKDPENKLIKKLFFASLPGLFVTLIIYLLLLSTVDFQSLFQSPETRELLKRSTHGIVGAERFIKPGTVNAQTKEGITPLMGAATYADLHLLKTLLLKGAKVDMSDENGETALFYAIRGGGQRRVFSRGEGREKREEIVQILLDNGSDVNHKSDSGMPLELAAQKGNLMVVKLLFNKGAKGCAALNSAIEYRNKEVAQFLIAQGVDVNGTCSTSYVMSYRQNRYTPLMIAANRRDSEIFKLLLLKGANINAKAPDGTTPLVMAMKNYKYQPEMANTLLAKGANVNCSGEDDISPLSAAAALGNSSLFNSLLDKGGIYQPTTVVGKKVFFSAIEGGSLDITQWLLKHGASPNAIYAESTPTGLVYKKNIPLAVAVWSREPKIVEALIKAGANPTVKDDQGRTPLETAEYLIDHHMYPNKPDERDRLNRIIQILEGENTDVPK